MIARRSWLGIDSANDRIESETPQELAEWSQARRRWAGKHGWIGGSLAMLKEERATRRGEPAPAPDWPFWSPVGP